MRKAVEARPEADLQAIQTSVAFKKISDTIEQYRRSFGYALLALVAFSAIHVGLVVVANLYTLETRVQNGFLIAANYSTASTPPAPIATARAQHVMDLETVMTQLDETTQIATLQHIDSIDFIDSKGAYRKYTVTGYSLGGHLKSELQLFTAVGDVIVYTRGQGYTVQGDASADCNCTETATEKAASPRTRKLLAHGDGGLPSVRATSKDRTKASTYRDEATPLSQTANGRHDESFVATSLSAEDRCADAVMGRFFREVVFDSKGNVVYDKYNMRYDLRFLPKSDMDHLIETLFNCYWKGTTQKTIFDTAFRTVPHNLIEMKRNILDRYSMSAWQEYDAEECVQGVLPGDLGYMDYACKKFVHAPGPKDSQENDPHAGDYWLMQHCDATANHPGGRPAGGDGTWCVNRSHQAMERKYDVSLQNGEIVWSKPALVFVKEFSDAWNTDCFNEARIHQKDFLHKLTVEQRAGFYELEMYYDISDLKGLAEYSRTILGGMEFREALTTLFDQFGVSSPSAWSGLIVKAEDPVRLAVDGLSRSQLSQLDLVWGILESWADAVKEDVIGQRRMDCIRQNEAMQFLQMVPLINGALEYLGHGQAAAQGNADMCIASQNHEVEACDGRQTAWDDKCIMAMACYGPHPSNGPRDLQQQPYTVGDCEDGGELEDGEMPPCSSSSDWSIMRKGSGIETRNSAQDAAEDWFFAVKEEDERQTRDLIKCENAALDCWMRNNRKFMNQMCREQAFKSKTPVIACMDAQLAREIHFDTDMGPAQITHTDLSMCWEARTEHGCERTALFYWAYDELGALKRDAEEALNDSLILEQMNKLMVKNAMVTRPAALGSTDSSVAGVINAYIMHYTSPQYVEQVIAEVLNEFTYTLVYNNWNSNRRANSHWLQNEAERGGGYGCNGVSLDELRQANTDINVYAYDICYMQQMEFKKPVIEALFFSKMLAGYDSFSMYLPPRFCHLFKAAVDENLGTLYEGLSYRQSTNRNRGGGSVLLDYIFMLHGWSGSHYFLHASSAVLHFAFSGIPTVTYKELAFTPCNGGGIAGSWYEGNYRGEEEICKSLGAPGGFMVIAPDGGVTPLARKSWYSNSAFTGFILDYVVFELPTHIVATMGFTPRAVGVFGFSMGAFGTYQVINTYPAYVVAAAAFNAPLYPNTCFFTYICHINCHTDLIMCELLFTTMSIVFNAYVILFTGSLVNSLGVNDPMGEGVAHHLLADTGGTPAQTIDCKYFTDKRHFDNSFAADNAGSGAFPTGRSSNYDQPRFSARFHNSIGLYYARETAPPVEAFSRDCQTWQNWDLPEGRVDCEEMKKPAVETRLKSAAVVPPTAPNSWRVSLVDMQTPGNENGATRAPFTCQASDCRTRGTLGSYANNGILAKSDRKNGGEPDVCDMWACATFSWCNEANLSQDNGITGLNYYLDAVRQLVSQLKFVPYSHPIDDTPIPSAFYTFYNTMPLLKFIAAAGTEPNDSNELTIYAAFPVMLFIHCATNDEMGLYPMHMDYTALLLGAGAFDAIRTANNNVGKDGNKLIMHTEYDMNVNHQRSYYRYPSSDDVKAGLVATPLNAHIHYRSYFVSEFGDCDMHFFSERDMQMVIAWMSDAMRQHGGDFNGVSDYFEAISSGIGTKNFALCWLTGLGFEPHFSSIANGQFMMLHQKRCNGGNGVYWAGDGDAIPDHWDSPAIDDNQYIPFMQEAVHAVGYRYVVQYIDKPGLGGPGDYYGCRHAECTSAGEKGAAAPFSGMDRFYNHFANHLYNTPYICPKPGITDINGGQYPLHPLHDVELCGTSAGSRDMFTVPNSAPSAEPARSDIGDLATKYPRFPRVFSYEEWGIAESINQAEISESSTTVLNGLTGGLLDNACFDEYNNHYLHVTGMAYMQTDPFTNVAANVQDAQHIIWSSPEVPEYGKMSPEAFVAMNYFTRRPTPGLLEFTIEHCPEMEDGTRKKDESIEMVDGVQCKRVDGELKCPEMM